MDNGQMVSIARNTTKTTPWLLTVEPFDVIWRENRFSDRNGPSIIFIFENHVVLNN